MRVVEMQAKQDSFVADHISPSIVSVKQVRVNPASGVGSPKAHLGEEEIQEINSLSLMSGLKEIDEKIVTRVLQRPEDESQNRV